MFDATAADPGGLGGTYAGNPLRCVAALAVLDIFAEEKLLNRAVAIGNRLRDTIDRWSRAYNLLPIAGPRALIGFDILKQGGAGESMRRPPSASREWPTIAA